MRVLVFSLIFLALSAWGRQAEDNLTRDFARYRRAQVESVDYVLEFKLTKELETYEGRVLMDLKLRKTKLPLSIDMHEQKITAVSVNGKPVTPRLLKGSLEIPAAELKSHTLIEIFYTNAFSKESSGFQRSVDPEDKSVYLFTDFEPYYAHWMFPCLDQPDLKTTIEVKVRAPGDWKVVSNDLLKKTTEEGEMTLFEFFPTKPISTYLFFLGAGPFSVWKDAAEGLPLELYARKSLAKYVDHERIFETTKKGLKFFNHYFGVTYPFPKYGQVFIPEFAWGGMENPGAVALNERNIFRGAVTNAKIEDRDNLILHEMAHMWFGDLVTMEWWNDLWLNESFATYLASIAQSRALGSSATWMDFFSTKAWGYWQDQLVTTHPIETPVPDVRTAKGNFDGITYAKGASALKQLHFLVGEEAFQKGLVHYFQTYSFKNTQRHDFTAAIGKFTDLDLGDWSRKWLQTAGPNRVSTSWSCKDGKIQRFDLKQSPSVSKTLSPHRTQIGLFTGKEFTLKEKVDVAYSKASTPVATAIGKPCPDFVYPNFEDQDYALFELDPVSLTKAPEVLTGSQDPLLRFMLWNTLEQMMRDGKLAIPAFFDIAMTGLQFEQNDLLLGFMLGRNSSIRTHYFFYLTPTERAEIAPRLEKTLWDKVAVSGSGSSLQLTVYDFLVSVAQMPESLKRFRQMLEGKQIPEGLSIDQDRRWSLVSALARNGASGAEELISGEEKRDVSTTGVRNAYAARISLPERAQKEKFMKVLRDPKQLPFSTLEAAADVFHDVNRPELTAEFIPPYFDLVSKMNWNDNDTYVEVFFQSLLPKELCTSELLRKSQKALGSTRSLTALAKRSWRESNDELQRCVKARAKLGKKSL